MRKLTLDYKNPGAYEHFIKDLLAGFGTKWIHKTMTHNLEIKLPEKFNLEPIFLFVGRRLSIKSINNVVRQLKEEKEIQL